jgi:hypothetical protein
MPHEIVSGLLLKWIGSLAGAALSLLFMPPRNWQEFRRRGAFSIVSGMVFAVPVRDYTALSNDAEGLVAGAALAAAVGWIAMETLVRLVRAYRREP